MKSALALIFLASFANNGFSQKAGEPAFVELGVDKATFARLCNQNGMKVQINLFANNRQTFYGYFEHGDDGINDVSTRDYLATKLENPEGGIELHPTFQVWVYLPGENSTPRIFKDIKLPSEISKGIAIVYWQDPAGNGQIKIKTE